MVFSPTLPPSRSPNPTSASARLASPRLADLSPDGRAGVIPQAVVRGLVGLLDVVIGAMVGLALGIAFSATPNATEAPGFWVALSIPLAAMLAFAQGIGLYSGRAIAAPLSHLPHLVLAWVGAITAAAIVLFIAGIPHEPFGAFFLFWSAAGALCLFAGRSVAGWIVNEWERSGRLQRRAAIYGTGDIAADVIRRLEADPMTDIRICGLFDDRQDGRAPTAVNGYPRLGTLEGLLATGRKTRLDLIIVALPAWAEGRLSVVVDKLSQLPADIRLPATASRIKLAPRLYSHVGPVAMIDLHDKPIAGWRLIAKSLIDKVLASLALLILAPLMLGLALAIKLDSRGPVFFRQTRYGFNNEPIEIVKFRSMYEAAADATASKLVCKDDARVTRIGRIIRKSSLDELPQLFNVLRGDLSLVGPRPHAPAAKAGDRLYADVVDRYFSRHKVKPGITGWAQINGWRGETNTRDKIEKRVEYDLYYIENWSLSFDFYILALTPFALLKADNAY